MTVMIFGGAGFVGLNIAETLLARGRSVLLFDRTEPPEVALHAFRAYPGHLATMVGDVMDRAAVGEAITPAIDAIVLGAAVTAGPGREAEQPEAILNVNLLSLIPILESARRAGVRRIVNLSSGAAYGAAGDAVDRLDETVPADPVSLYSVSKFASERVGARLAALWRLDFHSARLSTVFGPWERATGVRDTLSPFLQMMMAADRQEPAILPRPGYRDWIYAPDVADGVARLVDAPVLRHALYNISTDRVWSALSWGERLAQRRPGFSCRLAEDGEVPTIDLHAPSDRAPLSITRMRDEFGWSAHHGIDATVDQFDGWWRQLGGAKDQVFGSAV